MSDVFLAHAQSDAIDQQLTDEDLPPRVAVVEVSCFIITEKQIVVRDFQFPDAMQLIFCLLFFDLNLEYSQQKKKSPSITLNLRRNFDGTRRLRLSPKIATFVNAITAYELPEGYASSDGSAEL